MSLQDLSVDGADFVRKDHEVVSDPDRVEFDVLNGRLDAAMGE